MARSTSITAGFLGTPLSLEDARRLVKGYVEHYNDVRLNSAICSSRRRTCSPVISGRFRPSGEGTAKELPPAGRVTDETDHFRIADDLPGIAASDQVERSTS
jgi:hypothetical protein